MLGSGTVNDIIQVAQSTGGNNSNIAVFLLILLLIFWIYSLLWVAKDIGSRTSHLGFQLLSIFLILLLTPVLGLPIYFLIRPIQRRDVNASLWHQLLQARTITCSSCFNSNDVTHQYCAFCGDTLKKKCNGCKKSYPHDYHFCPFCGEENITQEDEIEEMNEKE